MRGLYVGGGRRFPVSCSLRRGGGGVVADEMMAILPEASRVRAIAAEDDGA